MCMGIDVSISMKCFLPSSTFAFGVESGFEKHFFHSAPVEFLCLFERKVIVQSNVCNDQMKNQVKTLGAMFSVIIAGETDEHMNNNKST